MLEVKNLSHHYGRVQVLQDLNFTVMQGEIVGLLGPNGAGKSTTLRMIAGLMQPDRGRISLWGIDTQEEPEQCRSYSSWTSPRWAWTRAKAARFAG